MQTMTLVPMRLSAWREPDGHRGFPFTGRRGIDAGHQHQPARGVRAATASGVILAL